jgi:DNA-binding MarR family transcriptional regulator
MKILRALADGHALSFSEIFEKTRLSTATLSKYLRILEGTGEVERKLEGARIVYTLTPIGRQEAHLTLTELENVVVRKLYLYGAALDLQKKCGMIELILGAGIPALKDMVKSFSLLGTMERQYLNFLAELYVHSVKKFLDNVEGELSFIELRAAWQVLELDAWNKIIDKEGLTFDFKGTWEKYYGMLSDELKGRMAEMSLNEEVIFRKLRAFSFPAKERIRLVKKGLL